MLLAKLGAALHRRDPQFHPSAYGAEKLISLLRLIPDVGSVVESSASGASMFIFGDDAAGRDVGGELRLRQEVWKAVSDFRSPPGGRFLDLDDFSLRDESTDPQGLLAAEPERFIALPSAGAEFQKDLARRFVAAQRPELAQALEGRLGSPQWFSAIRGLFETAGLEQTWNAFRTNEIVAHVKAWAERHGVPIDKIAHRLATSPPRRAPARETSPDVSDDLRALIHDAIDLMTQQELSALSIPPVYLVMAAMRRQRTRDR